MDPIKLKELVIGSTNATFNMWADLATKASGGGSVAIQAIKKMQTSIITAAQGVEARVYPDDEFSTIVRAPGVDLAYRSAIVSDASRDDEWIAALAIGFDQLDEHSRKMLQRHHEVNVKDTNLASSEPSRLLISLMCAKRVVTLDTFFTIVVVTPEQKLALVPAPVSWAISQANGPHFVINHLAPETYQDRLDSANRRFSVIDSAPAATLLNQHIRGVPTEGSMH